MSSRSGRQQGVAVRTPTPGQRPRGAWPVARPFGSKARQAEQRHHQDEHARFVVTLGSVRADLEEQPSRRAIRAAARRWCTAIVQLAAEVENTMREAS